MDIFFNDTATTEIYTLSLHDALPIFSTAGRVTLAANNINGQGESAKIDLVVQQGSSSPNPQPQPSQSQCLIATATFGSELAPQVQYLRHFRDNYILSTSSGSAFMKVFDSVYYSFSPQVAEYEREQPWMQSIVKVALYPLFGILMASERVHVRSEERRVGKECRSRWSPYH